MVLRSPVESGAEDVGSTGERKNPLEPFQALAVDDSNNLEIEWFKREPILASVGCDRRNCITLAIPDFVNSKSLNLSPERRQQWSLDFQGALESLPDLLPPWGPRCQSPHPGHVPILHC